VTFESADQGVDMSEGSSSLYQDSEADFCAVWVPLPVNKMLLQELNNLIGIKVLTSDFLEIFGS